MNAAPGHAPVPPSGLAPWRWPIVILRIGIMLAWLFVALGLYYACAPFTRHNPVPRLFLRGLAAICGIHVSASGKRPAGGNRKTGFYIANHISWTDIPALAGLTGTAFVAHDGLATFAPLRWLCELNDTVFVARGSRQTVASQIAAVRKALGHTGALTIFPEATTSDGQSLLPFRSSLLSAIDADTHYVPVQPLWLDYGANTALVAWVGEESGIANALRILGRYRPVRLTIHFLAPLEGHDRADRKAMARAASAAIEKRMAEVRNR